ncbi:MAG: hypothetical protein ACR2L2_12085 [Acidobacteriota bacterium]
MSLLDKLFNKPPVVEDWEPKTINEMPVSPYRVLHVGIPFFRDEQCRQQVDGAHLLILQLAREQARVPITGDEPLPVPTRRNYQTGQLVNWWLNHKQEYEGPVWYHSPVTGKIEKAWNVNHVEFDGRVVTQ